MLKLMSDKKSENIVFKFMKMVCEKLEFNFYIDFINGNFVTLVIACFINLGVLNNESPGETFSSFTAVVLTILIFVYLGWSFYVLISNRKLLQQEKFDERFGALYDDLKAESLH